MAGIGSPPRDDRIFLLPGPDILFRDTRLDGPEDGYPAPPPQYSWRRSSSPKAAIIILVVAAAVYSTCITGILIWQWRKYRRDVLQRQNHAASELARSMRAVGTLRGRDQDGQSTRAVSSSGDSSRSTRDGSQRQQSRDARSAAAGTPGTNDTRLGTSDGAITVENGASTESWGEYLRLHFSRNGHRASHIFPDVFTMWLSQQGERRGRNNPSSNGRTSGGGGGAANSSAHAHAHPHPHPHRFHGIHRTGSLAPSGSSGSRRSHRSNHGHSSRSHAARSAAASYNQPAGGHPGAATSQGGDVRQGNHWPPPPSQGHGMRRSQGTDLGQMQAVGYGMTPAYSGNQAYPGMGAPHSSMTMGGGNVHGGSNWGYTWAQPPVLRPSPGFVQGGLSPSLPSTSQLQSQSSSQLPGMGLMMHPQQPAYQLASGMGGLGAHGPSQDHQVLTVFPLSTR